MGLGEGGGPRQLQLYPVGGKDDGRGKGIVEGLEGTLLGTADDDVGASDGIEVGVA